jgi:predicted ribosome quality control (RQC) complex YloA/Tae2 family protein
MKPRLNLKPMDTSDESTARIYSMVDETVRSFNIYVADFFESIAILEEELGRAGKGSAQRSEIEGKIAYMRGRIEELSDSMKKIAEEMHSLVELHHSA